eukprot:1553952-Pyramimonas_sp.AAC.1
MGPLGLRVRSFGAPEVGSTGGLSGRLGSLGGLLGRLEAMAGCRGAVLGHLGALYTRQAYWGCFLGPPGATLRSQGRAVTP